MLILVNWAIKVWIITSNIFAVKSWFNSWINIINWLNLTII